MPEAAAPRASLLLLLLLLMILVPLPLALALAPGLAPGPAMVAFLSASTLILSCTSVSSTASSLPNDGPDCACLSFSFSACLREYYVQSHNHNNGPSCVLSPSLAARFPAQRVSAAKCSSAPPPVVAELQNRDKAKRAQLLEPIW